MSEKTVVVDGATCKCKYGTSPDNLKVKSQTKDFANNGKLIVTTKEVGSSTFQKNSFGSCNLQRNKTCKTNITEWTNFYEPVILDNGGQIILEDSKAVCPIAGSPCIEIVNHGQIETAGQQNVDNVDEEVHAQVNPLINIDDMNRPEYKHPGMGSK